LQNNEIYYCEPIYRPPSEANSLLIQVTEGCTHRCTFCISNSGKKFKIRTIAEIKRDLEIARRLYGDRVERIFFLDGNALAMPFENLLEITRYAKSLFPDLKRTGLYAHSNDILNKSEDELKTLADAGLKMAYIGIETGDDALLEKIHKQQTAKEVVQAFHRCFKSGITPSGTIILGLAGKNGELSARHAKHTADLVNRASPSHLIKDKNIPPWYISCLALMIPEGTPIYKDVKSGAFTPMNPDEILHEMKTFIENISDDVNHCIFRSNHASNYLALEGVLSKDKAKILDIIETNLKYKTDIRPEYFRGL
jgi:radical SAM superfamily enzyme YgiQ (UPF0313 family)